MNEIQKKSPLINVLLLVLIIATMGLSVLFAVDTGKLNRAYSDIMQVEAISSTTQRQISLSENNEHQQREIFNISDLTQKALTVNSDEAISLMSDSNIAILGNRVLEEWLKIQALLSVNWNLADGEEVQELDYISLRLARDAHFSAMTDLSKGIEDHTKVLSSEISRYQFMIMSFVLFIGLILFNKALQTRAELIISKEMAEKSQIDTATGLYNRSRCQDLFKGNQSISRQRKPAIMVLDLNDLKKTNDNLGHRVGDELIYSFATLLKKACAVHTLSPFIGRYGGDEFIVYYENINDEGELQVYLKELSFLTKEFNDRESRFQVSYAVGYSYVGSDVTENLTARQLFDKADEAMYVNKLEGKRAKNPDYDQDSAKGETR